MRVRVFNQHEHNGIVYPAGSVIDMDDRDAEFLLRVEGAKREEIIRTDLRYRQVLADAEGSGQ